MTTSDIIKEANKMIAEAEKKLADKKGEDSNQGLIKELLEGLRMEKADEIKNEITRQIITEAFKEAVKEIKIEPPKVEIPPIKVPNVVIPDFPKIVIPPIKVPTPQVMVNPPDVIVPEIKMPKEMKISNLNQITDNLSSVLRDELKNIFSGINEDNPLPVEIIKGESGPARPITQILQRTPKIKLAWGEVPSGAIDGSNTNFVLANTPVDGANLMVYVNGALQKRNDDYTISVATISLTSAPPSGSNIIVFYEY